MFGTSFNFATFFEILHNFWKTAFLTCAEQLNSVLRNKLGHHQRAPHLTVDCTLNLYHVSYFIQSDRWKLNRWVTMNLLIVWGRGGWGWMENVNFFFARVSMPLFWIYWIVLSARKYKMRLGMIRLDTCVWSWEHILNRVTGPIVRFSSITIAYSVWEIDIINDT